MSDFNCICMCYKRALLYIFSNVRNFLKWFVIFYVPGRRCKWMQNFEINSNTLRRGSKPMEDRVELTRVYAVNKILIL